jgi:hypothetical protein
MKTILSIIIVACLFLSANAQEPKPVKSFTVSLIQGNWDQYGFSKEYCFVNFQLKNDSFIVRYLNTVDTIYWQTTVKKDNAQFFINKLKSFSLDKDYLPKASSDKTVLGSSLSITINKKTQKLSYATPFTDSIPFKSCVDWLIHYAKQNSTIKSKKAFLDYACTMFDTTHTNPFLAEILNSQSYTSENPLLANLNKTKDWNIRHGILKALCHHVSMPAKEALGTLLNQNKDKPHEDIIVDALMCQYNDDYTKNLLLKAMQTKNRDLREKIMKFLAIESVKEVKPEVLAYIHRTFSENNASIKPNTYFEITTRIADKELVTDLILLYQKNKTNNTNSPVLKELMHAIECNLECYRNIHNEYVFAEFPFNFEVASKRLDAKIEVYLKK